MLSTCVASNQQFACVRVICFAADVGCAWVLWKRWSNLFRIHIFVSLLHCKLCLAFLWSAWNYFMYIYIISFSSLSLSEAPPSCPCNKSSRRCTLLSSTIAILHFQSTRTQFVKAVPLADDENHAIPMLPPKVAFTAGTCIPTFSSKLFTEICWFWGDVITVARFDDCCPNNA